MTASYVLLKVEGFHAKNKHKINYPNLHSVMRIVFHNDELPIPELKENLTYDNVAVEI